MFSYSQGQLCSRCLRNADERINDDISILDPEEEYEDLSMMDALVSETRYHSSVSLNIQQVSRHLSNFLGFLSLSECYL